MLVEETFAQQQFLAVCQEGTGKEMVVDVETERRVRRRSSWRN